MDTEIEESVQEAFEGSIVNPISGNIRGYYKGYSIQLTMRDPEVKIKPLLDKVIEIADYMDSHGFNPSWNTETNLKTKPVQTTLAPAVSKPANQTMVCSICGETAEYKEGISRDKIVNGVTVPGKPYKAVFCSTGDKTHTKWIK